LKWDTGLTRERENKWNSKTEIKDGRYEVDDGYIMKGAISESIQVT